MKCNCGDKDCVSEVGFDSACGLLIAEGNPGAAAAGIYLSVTDAIVLAQQLRAFILSTIDAPVPGTTGWDNPSEAHKAAGEP